MEGFSLLRDKQGHCLKDWGITEEHAVDRWHIVVKDLAAEQLKWITANNIEFPNLCTRQERLDGTLTFYSTV